MLDFPSVFYLHSNNSHSTILDSPCHCLGALWSNGHCCWLPSGRSGIDSPWHLPLAKLCLFLKFVKARSVFLVINCNNDLRPTIPSHLSFPLIKNDSEYQHSDLTLSANQKKEFKKNSDCYFLSLLSKIYNREVWS